MGYAASLDVCPPPRPRAPNASPPMWTSWPRPSATGIAMSRCAPTSPACACPGSARASSRWPRASIRGMSGRATSRCTTSSPTPRGTPPRCCAWPATGCWRPMVRHGPVAAWIVDDTGFPKKGQHSVGVARQYCGVLGKQDNCQVAVSVSVANEAVSLPVAYQLYLPESWASDRRRRRAAGVPDDITFQPKWQIALGQIQAVQAEGVPRRPGGRGCRLRRHDRVSRGAHHRGAGVRRRREEGDDGVAAGRGAAAPEALEGPRPAAHARAAYRDTHPAEPQAVGRRAAADGVADGDVAGRDARRDALPLRAAARAARPSR